jgi:D-alanyl-D-alanine carboxypeptidase
VLHSEYATAKRYPASLTKIMTLYLLFEDLESKKVKLSTRMKISKKAAGRPPTKLGLRAGKKISVKDALLGLMIKSANDAAVVIAEHLEGSERAFAARMTRKARALGMTQTVFKNCHGLPNKDQRTTAEDMATLGRALLTRFPIYYRYVSTQSFWYQGRKFKNHNHLLGKVKGVDGIKTGYINASGFNLVTSALREGTRLIAVVMGGRSSQTRDRRMAQLLEVTFKEVLTDQRIFLAHLTPPKKPFNPNQPCLVMAKSGHITPPPLPDC